MSQFKVYKDECPGATLVSNAFIDEFMEDANDAQIKIYLYLLRVISAKMSLSVSDLADRLNYTEKDVERALKYWQKKGLIELEYAEDGALIGVRLLNIGSNSVKEQNVKSSMNASSGREQSAAVSAQNVSVKPVLAPVVALPVRNEYSLDEIAAYRNRPNIKELIFVVEQYLGKTLSPANINSLIYFQDELGFSVELIDYLFEYCANKGKKDFRYIEKVAIAWHEEGVTSPEEALKASGKYDKNVYDIMRSLGKNAAPTKGEVDFITRWTKEYDFDMEIITEACERTVMATDNHRFEYADKILRSWHDLNVHHKADIDALDSKHVYKKKTSSDAYGTASPQYKQFSHDNDGYSDLEKELLSN